MSRLIVILLALCFIGASPRVNKIKYAAFKADGIYLFVGQGHGAGEDYVEERSFAIRYDGRELANLIYQHATDREALMRSVKEKIKGTEYE